MAEVSKGAGLALMLTSLCMVASEETFSSGVTSQYMGTLAFYYY